MSFDVKKPSATMIGRFQPWHEGHYELFKAALKSHGQVTILCESVDVDEDNPYTFEESAMMIRMRLEAEDYTLGEEYVIMQIPRVAEVSSGRSPDYEYVEYGFDEITESISSTDIRREIKEHELERTDVGQPQEG